METDRKGNRDSVVWAPSRDLFIILLNGLFSFVVRAPWWLWPVHHAVPYFKPPKRPLLSRCVPERGRHLMENVLTIDVFFRPLSNPLVKMFSYRLCAIYFLVQWIRNMAVAVPGRHVDRRAASVNSHEWCHQVAFQFPARRAHSQNLPVYTCKVDLWNCWQAPCDSPLM